ncbi:MAG TPA: NRDE family protein [Acidimicrobiales bacterium]|nr:NRDE family protein [Acidimicrobiales bacterium]
MCLLVVVSALDPAAPLVVGANRDERLDRPSVPMAVLRHAGPRVLGGRDGQAGGTWLAVNDRGVVAGLTNRPSRQGRDPTRRSRGELPLALARHGDAAGAVEDFAARFRGADYNPAWLLVGDRTTVFALDLTGPGAPEVEPLGPGVHILENAPLHDPSDKVDHVRALLARARREGGTGAGTDAPGAGWLETLRGVLGDHEVPASVAVAERRPETLAACVHGEDYGTRSSTLVAVGADPGRPPRLLVADGHPCTAPFTEVTPWWSP